MVRSWRVARRVLPWGLVVGCSNGTDPSAPPMIATLGGSSTAADDGDDATGGDDDGPATTDVTADSSGGDSGDTGSAGPPDFSEGTWVFENVSHSDPMSLHPNRVVLEGGLEVVAWAETELTDIGVLNIYGALPNGASWATTPLTAFDTQNTYPALAAGPTAAYLVWTGATTSGVDRDLFFATATAAGWTDPRNLTDAFDAGGAASENEPAIGYRSSGELFIAYLSSPPPDAMGGSSTPTVYVVEMTPDNDPSVQVQVIAPVQANCTHVVAATAGNDTGHVVASCVAGGESQLRHVTDRSGTWDDDVLAGTTSGILSPDVAAGPQGDVHLVWIQDTPCGADLCDDVYYARTTSDVFGTPVAVTQTANLDERMPTVGADPWGRVIVVSQVRLDNVVGLYLSVSEDGGHTFGEAEKISPAGTVDDYQTPRAIAFTPEGWPSFVYERVVDGSDPLDIEIEVARFMPAG